MFVVSGCSKPAPVRQVELAKPQRTLTAMIIDAPRQAAWFIKLSGPSTMVNRNEADFKKFVDSFSLDGQTGEPRWQVPRHWRALEPSPMLVAEFSVSPQVVGTVNAYQEASEGSNSIESAAPASDSLDLESASEPSPSASAPRVAPEPFDVYRVQVSKLSLPSEIDLSAYRLENVNRWRRQLALPPIAAEQLAESYPETDLAGYPMTWIDLKGRLPDGAEANAAGARVAGSSGSQVPHEVPAGWREAAQPAAFSALTLEKADGNAMAQITVSKMNSGVPWEAQAERWAGQVGLRLTADELRERTEMIMVSGVSSERIDLASAESDAPDAQRIIAIRVVNGETAWFIRIKGRPSFIESELEAFDKFVQSLELTW